MMRVRETVNAFAGNPIVSSKREAEELYPWLSTSEAASKVKVLPFCDGKPLVSTSSVGSPWRLAWQALEEIHYYEDEDEDRNSHLVYLGDGDGVSYFAIGVPRGKDESQRLAEAFGQPGLTFFDVRSLMQAAEYGEGEIMGELSIAGHARAMLEWHKQASYCGRCGSSTRSIVCGQRRQCTNVKCNNKLYPRIDPVVIMMVIDKERDCAILGRQSRFMPKMWSCLAGFIESLNPRLAVGQDNSSVLNHLNLLQPGESLEEAVRRETREEVGLEVGDIVYHSSQPWPVGPISMSCQLMVGFFAYAKTFDIRVDKKELEDARWHRREDVMKLLQNTKYKRDQQETIVKLQKAAAAAASGDSGAKQLLKTTADAKETTEMDFVPGPYAIAHHLISTWANQGPVLGQSHI